MNILMMVTWYTPKGAKKLEAGVFHYEQSMQLKKDCNVAIYFPFDQDMEEETMAGEEWGIMTYRSKNIPGRILYVRKLIKRTMKQIINEFHPDIIHAHCGCGAGYYAIAEGKRYNIPVIVTEHTPIGSSHVDKPGISHYFAKKAFSNSKANICVSEFSKKELSAVFPKFNFEVIYNGIIMPNIKNESKKFYVDGAINIVIVAVLYDLEIKGLKYLFKAMEQLKKQKRKIILHHIGGGKYLKHFQDMAKELDIEDICVFHGECTREELYEIVNEMDFFVSASLMECSGVSVEEAMLLGKPILGTNSGGVDSLVPKNAGMIVQKGNADALKNGIIEMVDRLKDYDKEWIKKYANNNFEIEHITKQYLELYNRILNSR